MKTIQKLKLIDGRFLPDEASKILLGLFSYKINYHQMELFSSNERFGNDSSNSKNRIKDLTNTTDALKKIINTANQNNHILQINCTIDIQTVQVE